MFKRSQNQTIDVNQLLEQMKAGERAKVAVSNIPGISHTGTGKGTS